MADYYVNSATGDDTEVGSSGAPWLHSPDDADWSGGANPLNDGDTVLYEKGQIHYGGGLAPSTTKNVTYDATGSGADPIYRACTDPSDLSWTNDGDEWWCVIAAAPGFVYHDDTELTTGSVGTLAEGEWAWSAGDTRVYVRLAGDAAPAGEDVLIPDTTYLINCYASVAGLTFNNMSFELSTSTLAGVKVNASSASLTFTSVKVSKCARSCFYYAGNTNVTMTTCTAVVRDVAYYGVYVDTGCSGISITNCDMVGEWTTGASASYGISITTSTVTITGGTISDLAFGIVTGGACADGLISDVQIDDCSDGIRLSGGNYTVEDSTISNCSSTQIYINSNSNTVDNNTLQCTGAIETAIGLQLSGADLNIITGNTILDIWDEQEYGSGGSGIGLSVILSSENNTIHGNLIDGCYEGLLLQEASGAGGNIVEYNIIKDSHVNGVAILTKGTSGTSFIYNNVIDHNPSGSAGHGIVFRGTSTGGPLDYADVRNNIIIGRNDDEILLFDSDVGTSWTITLDYNVYIQADAGAHWEYGGSGYTSFSAWQTALDSTPVTGGDDNSVMAIVSDFDADYKPNVASPVIDAGVNLGAPYDTDYDGFDQDEYGPNWDIGAYIFLPGTPLFINHYRQAGCL